MDRHSLQGNDGFWNTVPSFTAIPNTKKIIYKSSYNPLLKASETNVPNYFEYGPSRINRIQKLLDIK